MNFDNLTLLSNTKKPPIATLVGGPGMGKTSLAALWPDPIFITVENGMKSIDSIVTHNPTFNPKNVAVFGSEGKEAVFETSQDVFDAINWLRSGTHKRKTLVVDSVSRLHDIIAAEVLKADSKAKSLNAAHGGYGAGWNMVSEKEKEFRDLCGKLSEERDMNIVFIAHELLETVQSPDGPDYMRATLRMNGKSVKHYVDNVDLVAFIRLEMFVDKEKATGTANRFISCFSTPANVGKNRLGISGPIAFDLTRNPFEEFLK